MTAPDVSIVVPCHNYARFLRTCLDSALRQRLPEGAIEIIAIDDASTDETPEILRAYEPRGVRVVRQETNRGYVHIYRTGMALARGRMLLPLDADDFILTEDAVRAQLELADRSERIGFVHSRCSEVDSEGRRLRLRSGWGRTKVHPSARAFTRLLLGNTVQHTGTLIRRAAYEAVGGYDPGLKNSIDWDLWLRISRRYNVGFIDRPLYAYRIHGANMHQRVTTDEGDRRAIFDEVFAVIDRATMDRPLRERRRAHAAARVLMASAQLSLLRVREGAGELLRAIRLDPRVLARAELWAAVARLVLAGVLGPRAYKAVRARRRTG